MSRSGSRKRAAPEPTAGYNLTKYVEDAEWNYKKSNWNKKGEAEYIRLKQKAGRGKGLDGYEEYLMSVHFPKIAPTGHPIAGVEANATAGKKKRSAAKEPVFGDATILTQVYHHYLEFSCEITSYMEFV